MSEPMFRNVTSRHRVGGGGSILLGLSHSQKELGVHKTGSAV